MISVVHCAGEHLIRGQSTGYFLVEQTTVCAGRPQEYNTNTEELHSYIIMHSYQRVNHPTFLNTSQYCSAFELFG